MPVLIKTVKIVLALLLAYALYLLICSTLAYLPDKTVSAESRQNLDAVEFYGNGAGPDRVALLESPGDALAARIAVIRAAEQSIDLVCHAFDYGESTKALIQELLDAAERGVTVRLVVDGKLGVKGREMKTLFAAALAHPNIEALSYNRLDLLRPWTWHTVLHDKFINVDDTYLVLGGRNIGDRFFAPANYHQAVTNDRDVLVWRTAESQQSIFGELNQYMTSLWQHPECEQLELAAPDEGYWQQLQEDVRRFESENTAIYSLSLDHFLSATCPTAKITFISNPTNTTKKEPWVGYQLQRLALAAQESVTVQTPYATANRYLLETMTETASDAQLVMLTNSLASSPNFPAFSNYFSQRRAFLATGAAIYEYQSYDSIHGKSMVIDNRLSAVGSLNLDDRSFYIDTENMLVIDSPEFAAELNAAMEAYLAQSALVGADNNYVASQQVLQPPAGKTFLMYVVSILSRMVQYLI